MSDEFWRPWMPVGLPFCCKSIVRVSLKTSYMEQMNHSEKKVSNGQAWEERGLHLKHQLAEDLGGGWRQKSPELHKIDAWRPLGGGCLHIYAHMQLCRFGKIRHKTFRICWVWKGLFFHITLTQHQTFGSFSSDLKCQLLHIAQPPSHNSLSRVNENLVINRFYPIHRRGKMSFMQLPLQLLHKIHRSFPPPGTFEDIILRTRSLGGPLGPNF